MVLPVHRLTISFCIPTHGRTRLLREALESSLTQTRPPDEILVSDDLGSAETQALVADFASQTSLPVRYVHCTTGQSLATNINNCLLVAACDLILLLHDDDLLMPRAVEVLTKPFEENQDVVGAYGKQVFITEDGKELNRETVRYNRDYHRTAKYAGLQPDAIISGIWQQFPNDGYVVKASVAREVPHKPEFRSASEVDFGIRLGERGLFYFADEYTARYRYSAESLGRGASGKADDCAYHTVYILLRLLEVYPHYEPEIVKRLNALSPMSIRMAARTGRLKEAISWYFGPYHARRLMTPSGMRTGCLLLETWLKEKFSASSDGASQS